MRLLIIEDDEKKARALELGLRAEGFSVVLAHTGEEGFSLLSTQTFDLVILDWMLPGRDGIEILKAARARGTQTPVLLLTARDAVADRVLGLESGADDYLIKPFAFAELVARVRVLLRRGRPEQATVLRAGCLELNLLRRTAARGGVALDLKPREFEVLEYLVRHKNQTVTREML